MEPTNENQAARDHGSALGHAEAASDTTSDTPEWKPTPKLYGIIVGLGVANLLAALENTVVAVAAPVILTDLSFGVDFVWITNAFFLCSTVMQPLFGQLCNVFGRRIITLAVILIFVLGSGICGGASSAGMLIAGRAIQGAASGGIVLVTSVVISDLVPLRQRGSYSAIVMGLLGIGTAVGPVIGGAITSHTTWRWVFYLNLPLGAVSFVWLFLLLHTHYDNKTSLLTRLRRIDFLGNAVLVPSTVAVLYALSYAGSRYPWSSWHTLVPLLIGFAGFFLFAATQMERISLATDALMPARFFKNPTSIIICATTFLASMLLYWCLFFLPVYFQAVRGYSPMLSGASLLPWAILGIPGAMIGGIALVRWGRYKIVHIVAFGLQTVGTGLISTQTATSSVAAWVVFQCIYSLGAGLVFTTMLPAFQAFLDQRDLATCTATWYFIRMFGQIWGVAIPSAIFNNRIDELLDRGVVTDPAAVALLRHGGAFQSASAAFVRQWPDETQGQIRVLYQTALQRVFQIAIAFAGVGFLLTLLEKEIPLRTTLDTEYGLKENEKSTPPPPSPSRPDQASASEDRTEVAKA